MFVGDSITDWGRRADHPPLGIGYPRLVHDLILARYPRHDVRVINSGVGSDTVRLLANRWSDDVIRHRPDWVSILIGINDVHRWLENNEREAVSPEQFADLYASILDRVRRQSSAKLVLLDPFYASRDTAGNSLRSAVLRSLPAYIETVERLARRHSAVHLRLHEIFQRLIERHPLETYLLDPVHPHASGHMVIASRWLQALER